jgi:hypothetical protein
MASPRPIARSHRIPSELAAPVVEGLARQLGADELAAKAASAAVASGRFRVALAFTRDDGTPLTAADLEALRAFAPGGVPAAEAPPVSRAPAAKKPSKRAAKKASKRAA